jgi:hypothetical protein
VKKIDHDLNAAREAGVLAHFGITLISAETELNFDGCKGFLKRPFAAFCGSANCSLSSQALVD